MTYLTKSLLMAAAAILAFGCGDSNSGPSVDSDLPGIYAIDTYQVSPVDPETLEPLPDSCDDLADAPPFGDFLVIYPFEFNDSPGEPVLGGVFCNDVEQCRDVAMRAPEPLVGYSFSEGSDETGWVGFGNGRQGAANDKCLLDLQSHMLVVVDESIEITTDTVEVVFDPVLDGNDATCLVADGIRAVTPDLPCKSRLFLEATRSENL